MNMNIKFWKLSFPNQSFPPFLSKCFCKVHLPDAQVVSVHPDLLWAEKLHAAFPHACQTSAQSPAVIQGPLFSS